MAIAESAGCCRSSFYNWYKGASTARVDLLLRMCHKLRIPLTSLVTGAIAEPEAAARAEAARQGRRRRSPENAGPDPRSTSLGRKGTTRAQHWRGSGTTRVFGANSALSGGWRYVQSDRAELQQVRT